MAKNESSFEIKRNSWHSTFSAGSLSLSLSLAAAALSSKLDCECQTFFLAGKRSRRRRSSLKDAFFAF